jgi:hypothetical protein
VFEGTLWSSIASALYTGPEHLEVEVKGISVERAMTAVLRHGVKLFSLAIIALGAETIVCAGGDSDSLGPPYHVIPVLPWLPAIPWLAYAFGSILVLCGASLLLTRLARLAGLALAGVLAFCALSLDLPKYALDLGNMSLRTTLFEPLSLAAIACLLPATEPLPRWLSGVNRSLLCVALLVFGVDHIIGIRGIPILIPAWIPWRTFWVFFTGIVFIASGVSILRKNLQFWGMSALGSMFAVWVLVLHLPNCLGLNGVPGAPQNPNQWESLFIAIALWGGPWALALNSPLASGVQRRADGPACTGIGKPAVSR